jgi:Uma2 family endonuclease
VGGHRRLVARDRGHEPVVAHLRPEVQARRLPRAGVEQYWIVDPRDRSVEIWTRGDDVPQVARGSLVWRPVALGGEIAIDLAAIFRDVGPVEG